MTPTGSSDYSQERELVDWQIVRSEGRLPVPGPDNQRNPDRDESEQDGQAGGARASVPIVSRRSAFPFGARRNFWLGLGGPC